MMRFYQVGQIIEYDNFKLEVVEQNDNLASCAGCFFTENTYRKYHGGKISCCTHGLACTAHMRRDKKHVIFKYKEKIE